MNRLLHRCNDGARAPGQGACATGQGRLGGYALALGAWVSASGCGGATVESSADPGGDRAGSASAPLCDGGDGVQFAAWAGLGYAGPELAFSANPAAQFITIDGHCTYWLYDGSMEGLRTGVLDADFARQLSRELHLGHYAEVDEYSSPVCLDAGPSVIWDGTATLSNLCGPDDAGPSVWVEAFDRMGRLWAELALRSEYAWGPTFIAPFRDVQPPEDRVFHEWTSSFNLAQHVMSIDDFERQVSAYPPKDVGVLIEDAPTLALLGELRGRALAERDPPREGNPWYEYVPPELNVRDGQGNLFMILLRDRVPEAVVNGLSSAARPP
jgi:hypothetical protein